MAFKVPAPKGFNDEEIATLQQLLSEQIQQPFEDAGRNFLLQAIAKAREDKTWCIWDTKAMELLHDRFPFEFSGERPESRGTLNVADVPMSGSASVEIAPPPPPPEPAAPTTPVPGGTP